MSDSEQPTSQTSSQPASADTSKPDAAAAPAAAAPASKPDSASAAPSSTDSKPIDSKPADVAAKPDAKVPEQKPDAVAKADAEKPSEGEKPAEGESSDKKQATTQVPDAYTIEAPEGVKIDESFLPAMTPAFKEAGLTQAQVNLLSSNFINYQLGLVKQIMARDREMTMKDPELGGMNFGKTQGYVNDALAAFTTPEFRGKLERWGIANDLEFVRVFAAVGKAMRGDSYTRGQPTTAEESMADRIYGRAKQVGNAH